MAGAKQIHNKTVMIRAMYNRPFDKGVQDPSKEHKNKWQLR